MAGISGWRAQSGQAGLVAVVGACSVGQPILGPPVPDWGMPVLAGRGQPTSPQQVAVDRGHHHVESHNGQLGRLVTAQTVPSGGLG
jgi:hypothetical protein